MKRARDDQGRQHRHKRTAALDAAVGLVDDKDEFNVQIRRLGHPLFCLVETLIWCARARASSSVLFVKAHLRLASSASRGCISWYVFHPTDRRGGRACGGLTREQRTQDCVWRGRGTRIKAQRASRVMPAD